jgi:hypothetical protein
MSPAPSLFQRLLRRLVLRLVIVLGGLLGMREVALRARLAVLPEGHKRRAGLEAELARIERARALLDDPEAWEDPRFAGLVAEVARVRNDAGRRALARRRIYPNWFFALPDGVAGALRDAWGGDGSMYHQLLSHR